MVNKLLSVLLNISNIFNKTKSNIFNKTKSLTIIRNSEFLIFRFLKILLTKWNIELTWLVINSWKAKCLYLKKLLIVFFKTLFYYFKGKWDQ